MKWWILIGGIALFELSSLIAWYFSAWAFVMMFFWAIIMFAILYRSLTYGLGVMAIDLLIDPMGRMLAVGAVSFRIMLFAMLVCVWLVRVMRNRDAYVDMLSSRRHILYGFFVFMLVLIAGSVFGFFKGYPIPAIINDANGYAMLLLIPVVLTVSGDLWRFAYAGFFWLVGKSAFLFSLFTHLERPYFDSFLYRFFRDTRVAELTPLTDQGVRVFLQSHIFAALLLVVLIVGRNRILKYLTSQQYILLLSGSLFLVFMSLSRSMWLGVGLVSIWWVFRWCAIRDVVRASIISIGVLMFLFFVPFGGVGSMDGFTDMFIGRGEIASEYAAVSRWVMLPQLNTLIVQRPILGYGFGFSTDIVGPKHVVLSRSAFEWGWHDMLIKIGSVGLLAFLYVLWNIVRLIRTMPLVMSVLALAVIHVFTPYLNHPLGIGWLLALVYVATSSRKPVQKNDRTTE